MLILGIESSCDETAAAVVTLDGKVLSNVVSTQIPLHARFGGVIPEIASRNHLMAIVPTVSEALDRAGASLDRSDRIAVPKVSDASGRAGASLARIDRIAVTQGPGLLGSLLVGLQFAKTVALTSGVDLVPVHHVEGHITAVLLEDGGEHPAGPLAFPYVALAVSGGHTSLYRVAAPGDYALLAVTLDDAAGEAFDKVARLMGLPYPGGVEIDRIAKSGRADAIPFPRPLRKSRDFSFSGLKTAVRVYMEDRSRQTGEAAHSAPGRRKPGEPAGAAKTCLADAAASLTEAVGVRETSLADVAASLTEAVGVRETSLADVAASFQEAVVDVLVDKTLAAAEAVGAQHVVISGGVAANSRLRTKFVKVALARGFLPHVTSRSYCTDNAAMIAGAGRFGKPLSRLEVMTLEPFASGQLCRVPETAQRPEGSAP